MVLLHLLQKLVPIFRWDLQVAHFNHRLRGRASAADERFVRSHAERCELRFHAARWDRSDKVRAIAKHGVEMAARQARRVFFGEVAQRASARHVVLAHHADDQAELFFIRLFRGAGGQGLGGMRSKTKANLPAPVTLVRPLLAFTRADLELWAKVEKIRCREDASNSDLRFVRNKIRHELMPALEGEFGAGVTPKIVQTMGILADESDWWRAQAGRIIKNRRETFRNLPVPAQRHVIVLQLERLKLDVEFESVERLRIEQDVILNLRGDRRVSRDKHGILVEHKREDRSFGSESINVSIVAGAGEFHFGDAVLRWKRSRGGYHAARKTAKNREVFDADQLGSFLRLRHWRPGDRFHPIGMKHSSKLQNLFTNAKIPAAERRRKIVAENEQGRIFWVEGLRIGEVARLTDETTNCLEWRWSRQS